MLQEFGQNLLTVQATEPVPSLSLYIKRGNRGRGTCDVLMVRYKKCEHEEDFSALVFSFIKNYLSCQGPELEFELKLTRSRIKRTDWLSSNSQKLSTVTSQCWKCWNYKLEENLTTQSIPRNTCFLLTGVLLVLFTGTLSTVQQGATPQVVKSPSENEPCAHLTSDQFMVWAAGFTS